MRHRQLATMIVLPALAFAGCGSSGSKSGGSTSGSAAGSSPAAASAHVDIASYKYKPPAITVKAGAKVTWTNRDADKHTATAKAGGPAFDTGTLAKGQSKTVTLDKPGTYAYYCVYHAFMRGTVTVK